MNGDLSVIKQPLTKQDTVSSVQQMLWQPGGGQIHPSSTEVLVMEAAFGPRRRMSSKSEQGNLQSI